MKLTIIAIADKPPTWAQEAYQEYARRLPASLKPKLIELPSHTIHDTKQSVIKSQQEGKRVLQALPKNAYSIALDEHGTSWDSIQLAHKFAQWLELGRPIALLIGGAYGHAPEVLDQTQEKWSLSPLTFPHHLVRVILIEQLYRAWTLHTQHPYHKI